MLIRASCLAISLLLCLQLASSSNWEDILERLNSLDSQSPQDEPTSIDDAIAKAGAKSSRSFQERSLGGREMVTEGMDMVMRPSQQRRLRQGVRGRSASHTVATPWKDGVVPFEIKESHFNREQLDWIKRAMRNWEGLTCVRFRPATSWDANKVVIKKADGCWAELGMQGGIQQSSLADGCFWKGTIEHELGHVMGLIHEHQRPNRDSYIKIDYFAVKPSMLDQLTKYDEGSEDKFGLPYDYASVMHYGKSAFADVFGDQTIYPKDLKQTDALGMTLGPSFYDVELINLMYQCNSRCPRRKCPRDCFMRNDCQCFCKNDIAPEHCVDRNSSCTQWANAGGCRNNGLYMLHNCRKSCGVCTSDGSVPHLPCRDFKSSCSKSECSEDRARAKRQCKKTCGLCLNPNEPCRDKRSDCRQRAEKGECDTNAPEMLADCRKTCKLCPGDKPPQGGCQDSDSICPYYKASGACIQFAASMSQFCRKTCDNCDNKIVLPRDCVDTNEKCFQWAMAGECKNNPNYMLRSCKRSCNQCNIKLPAGETCVNFNAKCDKWAKAGECSKNKVWMAENCKLSCGVCTNDGSRPTTPTVICEDSHEKCPSWARSGECQANPRYMLKNCQKSCKQCVGSQKPATARPATARPDVKCEDGNRQCPSWARYGECQKNPGYMLKNCKKSCKQCVGSQKPATARPDVKCEDGNRQCPSWARYGECRKNPGYMLKNCKKSCKQCGSRQRSELRT